MHHDKIPARRHKRPETRRRAPQKCASGQNSRPDGPNDQKREGVHRRRARRDKIPAPTAQTTRNERACTAEGRVRTKFPARRPKRPETRGRAPQKRASGLYCSNLTKSNLVKKKNSGLIEKHKQLCSESAPWIPEKGNLVDKAVLPLAGAFFPPGGFENGLAGPASTREKSTRIFFKNYGRDARRSPYIYVWASPAFPSPRCLVVLLSFGLPFGVVVRSSRYQVHRGNLFAGVGRLGSQILIFGCGF